MWWLSIASDKWCDLQLSYSYSINQLKKYKCFIDYYSFIRNQQIYYSSIILQHFFYTIISAYLLSLSFNYHQNIQFRSFIKNIIIWIKSDGPVEVFSGLAFFSTTEEINRLVTSFIVIFLVILFIYCSTRFSLLCEMLPHSQLAKSTCTLLWSSVFLIFSYKLRYFLILLFSYLWGSFLLSFKNLSWLLLDFWYAWWIFDLMFLTEFCWLFGLHNTVFLIIISIYPPYFVHGSL